ncbi:hypothetical protein BC826DRAFT_1068776 [Russula brevipes]|nr:hypothetical protein BC826DRAFT_1068776 [Russula brevipes]
MFIDTCAVLSCANFLLGIWPTAWHGARRLAFKHGHMYYLGRGTDGPDGYMRKRATRNLKITPCTGAGDSIESGRSKNMSLETLLKDSDMAVPVANFIEMWRFQKMW